MFWHLRHWIAVTVSEGHEERTNRVTAKRIALRTAPALESETWQGEGNRSLGRIPWLLISFLAFILV